MCGSSSCDNMVGISIIKNEFSAIFKIKCIEWCLWQQKYKKKKKEDPKKVRIKEVE